MPPSAGRGKTLIGRFGLDLPVVARCARPRPTRLARRVRGSHGGAQILDESADGDDRTHLPLSRQGHVGGAAAKGAAWLPAKACRSIASTRLPRPGAAFDPERPTWLPKRNFLMLMTDERLAALRVAYDDDEGRLTIDHGGRREVDADLRTGAGREAVERFFEGFMGAELRGRPRLVSAPGHMFTDNATKYVSLINLASVADLERRLGQPIDPLRFRANLYVAGLRPGGSSTGWAGSSARATSGSTSPSGSIAAPRPMSIPQAACAISISRSPCARPSVTSTAACSCG